MKYAVCSEIFQGWTIDKAMAFARKTGYDGFEISPFTIAKYVTEIPAEERRRIREVAAGLGLTITGLHWVLAQTEGLYLNHPHAAIRARTSQYFCDLVDCCADLGGTIMVVVLIALVLTALVNIAGGIFIGVRWVRLKR